MDNTPQIERAAEATLRCMGIDHIDRRLNELSDEASNRMDALNQGNIIPAIGMTPIDYLNDEEREEFHLLQMSRQMYGQDERLAASRRFRERLERRRLRRIVRRSRLV